MRRALTTHTNTNFFLRARWHFFFSARQGCLNTRAARCPVILISSYPHSLRPLHFRTAHINSTYAQCVCHRRARQRMFTVAFQLWQPHCRPLGQQTLSHLLSPQWIKCVDNYCAKAVRIGTHVTVCTRMTQRCYVCDKTYSSVLLSWSGHPMINIKWQNRRKTFISPWFGDWYQWWSHIGGIRIRGLGPRAPAPWFDLVFKSGYGRVRTPDFGSPSPRVTALPTRPRALKN